MTVKNSVNLWSEFVKNSGELNAKNFESMSAFLNSMGECNEEAVIKNVRDYFDRFNSDISYLDKIWAANYNAGKEFRDTFRARIDETYFKFMDVYRETAKTAAAEK